MAFVTGLLLIDAPASALNNLGNIPGERFDNSTGVKVIRARDGYYPYVSAQSFRYWLRQTLERSGSGWKSAPIYREQKIAYTEADPIEWWDDDLFGYMRAPSTRAPAQAARDADQSAAAFSPADGTLTRIAPFRVSTLVSIAPVTPTNDFGVMSRHEGDPVPHEHQFYRATLKGLFSLDLQAVGTFSYRNKTGFRNLDQLRIDRAKEKGLEPLEREKAYRLTREHRVERVAALFQGMAALDGGAKQTLHYTDVAPVLTLMVVTRGGNNIFAHTIGANARGLPEVKIEALREALSVFANDLMSDVYVGWVRGYLDEERAKLEAAVDDKENRALDRVKISHPRDAFLSFIKALRDTNNAHWLE